MAENDTRKENMPETEEDTTRSRLKGLWGDFAARVKGESALSRSINRQRGPLEEIAKTHATDKQGQEAERMLKVIRYYEEALEDPEGQTKKLENELSERVVFLWETLKKHGTFNLGDPANPRLEIKLDSGGIIVASLRRLQEDERRDWLFVTTPSQELRGQEPAEYRAWKFYYKIPSEEGEGFRLVDIRLTPEPELVNEIELITNDREKQRINLNFVREADRRAITSWSTTKWLPIEIEHKRISGWGEVNTEHKLPPDIQEILTLENYPLALAIARELFEETEVTEDEIRALIKGNLETE